MGTVTQLRPREAPATPDPAAFWLRWLTPAQLADVLAVRAEARKTTR